MNSKRIESLKKNNDKTSEDAFIKAASEVRASASKQLLNFVQHVVDPKRNPPAPRPQSSVTSGGHVQLLPMKSVNVLEVGSLGIGFAIIDPSGCAGCQDRALGIATTASFGGGTATTLPFSNVASHPAFYPSMTGFTGAALTNNTGLKFSAQVNACGVYLKPTGSAVNQDGMVYLLEVPLHPQMITSSLTIGNVMSHKRTRSIAGNQVGTPGFDNVLNYHPQPSLAGQHEEEFQVPTGSSSQTNHMSLVVIVTGTVGATYSLEVYGSWSVKGEATQADIPVYTDVLGAQAFQNAMLAKRISGWVGNPRIAMQAYHLALGLAYHKVKPIELKERDEAKAVLEAEKSKKTSSYSWLHDAIRIGRPIVKELAGFFL
jgi:hypothetical protein